MCSHEGQTTKENNLRDVPIETALDLTGYGKYNHCMTFVCSLSMLGTIIEMFAIGLVAQTSSCDLELNLSQRGILTGVPMTGVIITAYTWGYLTDIKGRRTVLLISMTVGFFAAFLSSFAPNLAAMTILKFISMSFASASFAASYTYLGEFLPLSYRDKVLMVLSVANWLSETIIVAVSYPILTYLNFAYEIPLIGVIFKPWRLVIIVLSLPMAICSLCLLFLKESPKFLLINDKEEEAIAVLRKVYKWNTGSDQYPVHSLEIQKSPKEENKVPLLKSLRLQCEPLVCKPLLKYTVCIYTSLFCACFVANAFSMWFPYIFNKFSKNLSIKDLHSETFCTVFNYNSTGEFAHVLETCDDTMDNFTYIAIFCFGFGGAILNIIIANLFNVIGKKAITICVLSFTSFCAFILYWVPNALASLIIFMMSIYSSIVVGTMPVFIVEIYPTHVRGMAGCLSVMISRLGSSIGGFLTGIVFEPYCEGFLFAASGLLFICTALAFMLPGRKLKK